ncbi:MAG: ABC transporter ATP-binding protein/permease [Lentisphaeraceae bacterium]|nr:ABC transporter ATP-binding protein/permease [Lentisphaeraceae bacterium]
MYPNTRRFLKEYLPGKGVGYFWGIFFLLITIITTTSGPIFIKDAINLLTDTLDKNTGQRDQLLKVSIYIAFIGVTLCIARVLSRVLIFLQGRIIEAEVRKGLFDAVVNMPLDTISKYQSGDLISRGTNDVTSVRVMISMGILHTINTGLIVPLCLYQMFMISTKLTLICLIPLPIAIICTKFISNKMMLAGREAQNQLGVLSETVREQFRAHTLLSIFPVFSLINKQFEQENDKYSDCTNQLMKIRVFMMMIVVITLSLGMFILLRYGGPDAIANEQLGKDGFNIGAFAAFSLFLGTMQGPLRAAGFLLPLLQRGEVCLERIYEVRDSAQAASEIDSKRKYQTEIPFDQNSALISIKNLKYQYESNDNAFVLVIDKLEIEEGKKYGIFGKTGCGKTTLINAICGNIRTQGTFYRGISYEDIASNLLNSKFSLVPQDSKHFSKTIKENIDLVTNSSKAEGNSLEFEDAYGVSQLKGDIAEFKDGLDTLLGEHGINLSGGQKQRLSILRALVKPNELLIMDDYVSAVDHKTENLIISTLFEKVKDHTMLLVSHRISALIPCDSIIIMDEGKIIDQGSHEELYKRNEDYKNTYDHQILESKLEELQ